MNSPWKLACVLLLFGLSFRSSGVLAQQPVVNQPGMPTLARMYVLNKGTNEAIPVVVQAGGEVQPVAVISAPALTLAPGATVGTRPLRQAWEYRQLVVRAGEGAAPLNEAGGEGWEAVGTTAGPGNTVQVLLKRPR